MLLMYLLHSQRTFHVTNETKINVKPNATSPNEQGCYLPQLDIKDLIHRKFKTKLYIYMILSMINISIFLKKI